MVLAMVIDVEIFIVVTIKVAIAMIKRKYPL